MEDLKELIYIVNRNKVKRIDMLDLKEKSPSKVNALYQAISDGKVGNDDEASQLLFPNAKSKSAYRNLKAVLQDKLLNTLFFIDTYQKSYTDRQAAFYDAYKDFAAVQILLAKNARKVGIKQLEKLLKKALHFEFIELVPPILRLLRLHYGTRLGIEKKYRELDNMWEEYHNLERLENLAERYYSELVLHYVNSKSVKVNLKDLAATYFQELAAHKSQFHSYKFRLYTGLVQLFSYTCVNDYVSTIPVCEELIEFFEAKPFQANTPIQICLHHQLVAYMQLRDFTQGQRIAQRSQELIEEGAFNWFKNLEYLFLLAMHTANYQEAYQVFCQAVEHKRYKFLPEQIRENWQLYQAYVHLLIDQDKIVKREGDKRFTSFRINRFLNDMPLYSKDKRGMNIAILTVQILFYIQKGKYNTVIDRMEAIEKYCSRYLFNDDTMRSYYFIKLLLTIPQASFHRLGVLRYAEKPLKKMKAISTEMSNQYHKIEVMSYEVLWDMAVQMLGTQTVRLRNAKRNRKSS